MMPPSGALTRLHRACKERRSGEFIHVGSKAEVHVLLQEGCLVWATDNLHPREFGRHLAARCNIDPAAFQSVVEECRRTRAPFGETLVKWGMASLDDVRESLLHQIRLALQLLLEDGAGGALFLHRPHYALSHQSLTFSFPECVENVEPGAWGELVEPEKAAPPPAHPPSHATAAQATRTDPALGRAVRLEGARWVRFFDDAGVPECARGEESVPAWLRAASLAAGADFIALRTSGDALLGARCGPGNRQVWCLMPPAANFGASVAVVASLVPGSVTPPAGDHTADKDRRPTWGTSGAGSTLDTGMMRLLQANADVVGVAMASPQGELTAGMGRRGFSEAACRTILAARQACLATPQAAVASPGCASQPFDFAGATVVSREPEFWAAGVRPAALGGASLWVFAERRRPTALGLAMVALQALVDIVPGVTRT